jgi:hypothetical protein
MPRINRPQNKNSLKSDRDSTMSRNPAVRQDQFGSRHNADDVKTTQRQRGRPSAAGTSDLAFRESAQDSRTPHSAKNKSPGRRSTQKRATPKRKSSR